MKGKELKKGDKFWCWWLHRYLYFVQKYESRDNLKSMCYLFEDIADVRFTLGESQLKKLERKG